MELMEYLTRFAGQDEVLARVERETRERPNAAMLSRPDQARLLTLLARMLGAREALEIGTFTGYGAICIARGLAEGGRLTCFEVDEEIAAVARANVAAAGLEDRVTIQVGPAGEALAAIPEVPQIDLAYVDADKDGYTGYYEALVPRMRPGGVIVLDNMLLGERVLEPGNERGERMTALNERIATDERVESVLLGLHDGLTIARDQRIVSGVPIGSSAREPDDVRVAQPDAAVRDRARDQVRPVGAVDADVPAARPVGQRLRARAGPQRDRPVERALVAGQPVADDELPARSRGVGRADADRHPQHGPPVLE